MLAEGMGLVEEDEIVPLRPLGLVHREGVAVGELVGLASQEERQILLAAFEEGLCTATSTGLRRLSSSGITSIRR